MKQSLLARLPIFAAFMLSMGSLIAGTPEADSNCPRPCCPECQKGGCPLPGASKENPQQQKEDCDKPCPARQGEQGEQGEQGA